MGDATRKPRVALIGARDEELELLAELHRTSRADLVGIYDPDPNAAGLTLAEIVGVPAGSDLAARDRLAELRAVRERVSWASTVAVSRPLRVVLGQALIRLGHRVQGVAHLATASGGVR